MKYKLTVKSIWEYGQRKDSEGNPHQEDDLFPAYGQQKDSDRLFILCDGMGGHEAGEVASATVCDAMRKSIFASAPDAEGGFDDAMLNKAIADAFDALDAVSPNASLSAKKMGTTMTLLKFHDKGCTIAHIGDSRVYHIRPGKGRDDTVILHKTRDHSLVNDLILLGEMTPEEAKTSNQRNVITRAMQPGMERRPRADIYHTADIRKGDYFYLCSDGMLEEMEDEHIRFNFSEMGGDDDNKVSILTKATSQNKDNHTAIIVHILDVIDPIPVEQQRQDTKPVAVPPKPIMVDDDDDDEQEEVNPEGYIVDADYPQDTTQPEKALNRENGQTRGASRRANVAPAKSWDRGMNEENSVSERPRPSRDDSRTMMPNKNGNWQASSSFNKYLLLGALALIFIGLALGWFLFSNSKKEDKNSLFDKEKKEMIEKMKEEGSETDDKNLNAEDNQADNEVGNQVEERQGTTVRPERERKPEKPAARPTQQAKPTQPAKSTTPAKPTQPKTNSTTPNKTQQSQRTTTTGAKKNTTPDANTDNTLNRLDLNSGNTTP